MKRMVRIDFCCNNPDNGQFWGKVCSISYDDLDLEADNHYSFRIKDGCVRLHRRKYAFNGSREWTGNWSWNSYWLYRDDAKRLLNDLRSSGRWLCSGGPVRLCDWFERKPEPTHHDGFVPSMAVGFSPSEA